MNAYEGLLLTSLIFLGTIYYEIKIILYNICVIPGVLSRGHGGSEVILNMMVVMLLSSFHTNNSSIFSIQLYRDDSNSSGFVGYKHCVHSSKLEMRVTCGKMWGFILFHTYYTNVHIKEFWERILTYTRAHNLSIVLFACPALPANSIADMQAMIDNAHRRDLQALSSCRRCQLAIFHTNIDGEFKEVFSTSAKIFNESDWQL